MAQQRICRISGESFEISDKEEAFYESMGVPLPTTSPFERMRSMMAARNEWRLYRRKCNATGQDIVSAYPPDSPFTVYTNSIWWGDSWDPMQYGRDYDFSKPFFEQFAELQKVVPREGTTIFNSENCDYNSHVRLSRNCYLNSLAAKCEDVYYSYWTTDSKDILDNAFSTHCTLCFYCSDSNRCYHCVMVSESNDCNDCYFSYQLQGCSNCIFSSNLVRKNYYAFNKQVTKEEFEAIKSKALSGSWSDWGNSYQEFLKVRKESIQKSFHGLQCENVMGDHVYNSKNCTTCFDTFESEDCFNSLSCADSKDIYNAYSAGWGGCERVHMSCVSRNSTNIAFCTYTWFSTNMKYSDSCAYSQDCFGCIGVRHKQYCILNKQYTKEDYEALLPRIIEHMKKSGEWGEFFPGWLYPFAYNESGASDFLPLTKEEALAQGWKWRDDDKKEYLPATLANLPDNISDVPESITQEILACDTCGKNYRIIPRELRYYQQEKIPLPRSCSRCRFQEKLVMRNLPNLYKRLCSKCQRTIESTYSPERTEQIYCDSCYLKEVY